MKTETKTKLDDGTLDQWPPLAHMIQREDVPAKEGTIALCGAKLMGITLPAGSTTCKKCIEVYKQGHIS